MLPGEADAATKFLRSKVHDMNVHGRAAEIDNENADDVKLLLKKFLHREGLAGYRVLSESGVLRVVPDPRAQPSRDNDADDDKIKGVPPFPPVSSERLPLLQTVYPNYGSGTSLHSPRYKKARQKAR